MSSKAPELETTWRIKLTPELVAKIHELVEQCVDEKLPEALKKHLEEKEKLAEREVLKLKKIPHKKAVALVKKYVDEHQGCRTSDIIYDLALDPDLVLKVLKELEENGKIRGEDLG